MQTGKWQQYFLADTRVSKDTESLSHAAGLGPPPRYLTGNSLGKILKPSQKSNTEKLFSFMFSSYLHFSKNMTKDPNQTLFPVILEERDLPRAQHQETRPWPPKPTCRCWPVHLGHRECPEHSTQFTKTWQDATDNTNIFLRQESDLANPSLLKGSHNLFVTSWTYRLLTQLIKVFFKPQNHSSKAAALDRQHSVAAAPQRDRGRLPA